MSVIVADAAAQAADPPFAASAHGILAALVSAGAALGWVEPPSLAEVTALLRAVAQAAATGDGGMCAAYLPGEQAAAGQLIGLGYWTRYERPTHRANADLRRIAVAPHAQRLGAGRALTSALIESARAAGIEVLTLDARGDNAPALRLYHSLGFREYGRLRGFVAVGPRRYDTVFCALDLREQAPGRPSPAALAPDLTAADGRG